MNSAWLFTGCPAPSVSIYLLSIYLVCLHHSGHFTIFCAGYFVGGGQQTLQSQGIRAGMRHVAHQCEETCAHVFSQRPLKHTFKTGITYPGVQDKCFRKEPISGNCVNISSSRPRPPLCAQPPIFLGKFLDLRHRCIWSHSWGFFQLLVAWLWLTVACQRAEVMLGKVLGFVQWHTSPSQDWCCFWQEHTARNLGDLSQG